VNTTSAVSILKKGTRYKRAIKINCWYLHSKNYTASDPKKVLLANNHSVSIEKRKKSNGLEPPTGGEKGKDQIELKI